MNERLTTAGIYIKDGKVLLARRVEGGALSMKWEFPGGKNRTGESVEDTLKREYKEELGVDIIVKDGEVSSCQFENKGTHYTLTSRLIDIPDQNFHLSVHTTLEMVPLDKLLDYDLAPSDRQIASDIVNKYRDNEQK